MSVEYYKDKYIQLLNDKIILQGKVNSLQSEVIDLKAQLLKPNLPKLKSQQEKINRTREIVHSTEQPVHSTEQPVHSSAQVDNRRGEIEKRSETTVKKGSDRRSETTVKRGETERRSKSDRRSESDKRGEIRKRRIELVSDSDSESSVFDSSGSETDGDLAEQIPLTSIIDSRHSGTVGMLTNREKTQLKNTTLHFQKKYKLPLDPEHIPKGFVNKYNNYLDRKIDEGLFSSPKAKKKKRVFKVDEVGSPLKRKSITNQISEIPKVDPALVKLFDEDSMENEAPELSFKEKVVEKYQKKKHAPKISDTESELESDKADYVPQTEPRFTMKIKPSVLDEIEEVELESGESMVIEPILEKEVVSVQEQAISKSPIIINNALDDIDELMESTGYDLPSKNISKSFNESMKMRDLESQIFNRVSGSVLESSKSTQGWIPWDLLLKQRLDKEIGVEKRFITFTMNFCTENGISPKSVSVGSHSSMGIPPNLMDKYVKDFTARFYPSLASNSHQEEVYEPSIKDSISFCGTDLPQNPVLPEKMKNIIPSFDQVSAPSIKDLTTVNNNSITNGSPKKEPPMTRYNTLLTILMPNYNTQDKDKRLLMKKNVLQWLRGKLGSENVKLCKLQARAHDTVFTTFGVPKFLESSFLDWAREELQRLF